MQAESFQNIFYSQLTGRVEKLWGGGNPWGWGKPSDREMKAKNDALITILGSHVHVHAHNPNHRFVRTFLHRENKCRGGGVFRMLGGPKSWGPVALANGNQISPNN